MIRTTLLGALLLGGLAHDPGGCGSAVEASASGPNAPCTRDKDCKDGLSCEKGVCSAPEPPARDAGDDAAPRDAGEGG